MSMPPLTSPPTGKMPQNISIPLNSFCIKHCTTDRAGWCSGGGDSVARRDCALHQARFIEGVHSRTRQRCYYNVTPTGAVARGVLL
eukprot:1190287-Prorocentrum_minimum.AAC.5